MKKLEYPAGYITGRTMRRINGFVFNDYVSEACVDLFIGNRKIGEYDLSIGDVHSDDARIPFEIDLWTHGVFHRDENIRLKYFGRPIIITPNIAERVMMRERGSRKNKQKILLLHIPKTGGTSLREMLLKSYGATAMFPSKKELKKNNGKYFTPAILKEKIEEDHHLIYAGHYRANVLSYFETMPFTVCMLRKPFDQIVSLAKQFKTHNRACGGLEIEDILQTKILDNPQTRLLIPYKGPDETVKEQDLEIAKNTLRCLSYVGIFEQLGASMELLFNDLEKPIVNFPWKNKSKIKRSYFGLHDGLKEKIAIDEQLYEFAVTLFEDRYKEYKLG